jgi:4-amino-4-deoxy-L-arabinose transferase-like glycosyltransferase
MTELSRSDVAIGVKTSWVYGFLILLLAALIRLAFFRGALGTDEIVYLTQAQRLLNGDIGHAVYIGAVRYGINGFQALSIRLFGNGVAGAGGLYFLCWLGNALLAYWFAYRLWGCRAAIWTGVALAVLPLDVALATSLNPDPYLALFISGAMVVFFFAESHDSHPLYFLAGLLAGWVFWIKEEVIVFGLVFVIYAAFQGRWRIGWLWFVLGGFLCCVADLIFFWVAYGDPFYHYSVVHRAVDDQLATQSFGETSPCAYIGFLFIKIYHTGLLGWLALAGCMLALRRPAEQGTRFVLIWGIGLLLIFSLFPVSLSPPEFIRKTATYIEIFVTPLALLAGWFLAQQQRAVAFVLGGVMVASGILLSALEQQVVRVVTVNGQAAAAFAEAHAGTPVFGPLTAQRQSIVERLFRGSLDTSSDIRPWADLSGVSAGEGPASDVVAYLIDDPQMRIWPDATKEEPLSETLRRCLVPLGPLEQGDLGLGRSVVAALRDALSVLPAAYAAATLRATDSVWQVSPAQVYVVTRECAHEAQGKSASRSPPRLAQRSPQAF